MPSPQSAAACQPPATLPRWEGGHGELRGVEMPVSRLVFGCLFLHQVAEPFELLDLAWELGINCFDCAAIYGGGRCEEILGDWLRSRRRADDAVVITKGGCAGQDELWEPRLSAEFIRADLSRSLQRLGLRKVMCYMLHRDEVSRPVAEVVDVMDGLVAEGLIGSWAVSNWSRHRVGEALSYAEASGKVGPNSNSIQCSLAMPKRRVWPGTEYMGIEDRRWYADQGQRCPMLAWECLSKGFLAGRWSRADMAHLEMHHATQDITAARDPERAPAWRERQLIGAYLVPENFERRERCAQLAERLGATRVQIALAWVLSQPHDSYVLIGTTKRENLVEAVGAGRFRLSPRERDWLEGQPGSCMQEDVDVSGAGASGSF
eukprot:TRINITY_DN39564_c0_g1_i1.p1 TRINITY_DN39564_c0_g1~~TRINITY_DN39564_c0_g1_i1.p1  ORF type:complete len:392 (+),score=124.20 TRINITY_DN39564_c0_g1_i1:51-1178(+)